MTTASGKVDNDIDILISYATIEAQREESTEILPDVHRIVTAHGGRRLCQFFLAAEHSVLIDVGEAVTPEESIYPYLDSIGVSPESIEHVIITHADTDHHGGLAAIRGRSPTAMVGCGAADRALIESADVLVAARYRAYEAEHGIGYPPEALDHARSIARVPVDLSWSGGEMLCIGTGWAIEILATPGHTRGHIAIRDLRHNAIYFGDAIHGIGYPDLNNQPMLPPNYIDVEDYRRTIRELRRLAPTSLHGAHWPAMNEFDVERFLTESGVYLEKLEQIVIDQFDEGELTLADVIAGVQRQLPFWRDASPTDLAYSIEAHLRRLVDEGRLRPIPTSGIRRYRL